MEPARLKAREEEATECCSFCFVSADYLRSRKSAETLPRLQELLKLDRERGRRGG